MAYGVRLQEPPEPLIKLGEEYDRLKLKNVLERWTWPKTSDTCHFSKNVEQWHQASASDKPEGAEISAIWDSFFMNIAGTGITANSKIGTKKRLPVFASMEEKIKSPDPKIHPQIKLPGARSSHCGPSESTWRELLLGEGGAIKKGLGIILLNTTPRGTMLVLLQCCAIHTLANSFDV
jgi:hypothetical protein